MASFDYRDYELEAEPQSIFHKIFGAERAYILRKAVHRRPPMYRGGKLRDVKNLSRGEALHWLIYHPHGSALVQRTGMAVDKLADLLVEAASRFDPDDTDPADVSDEAERLIAEAAEEKVAEEEDEDADDDAGTDKPNEATDMAKEIGIVEICKSIAAEQVKPPTEHQLAQLIQKHASASRQPNESAAAAFERIVCAPDEDGMALRKALQVARGF